MKTSGSYKTKVFSIHTIKIKALGLYLFSVALIYLAGSYFGGVMLFLFYCFMLLPVFSIIFLGIAVRGIKFFQYFSTDHPIKGENIEYRVVLSNESFVSISEIASRFVTIHPLMDRMIPDFKLSLKRGETKELSYTIACSYRGIYQVGLDSVLITDIMNFFTINIPIWHKTFYVFPRIIHINSFAFGIESFIYTGVNTAMSGITDNTLLKGIREYRRTDSIRHMYWKRFAAIGQPVIKEYDISTTPVVSVYVDLFNENKDRKTITQFEKEDVTVEILTALAHYYLKANIKISIRCPCRPLFYFTGSVSEHFMDYYKQTNSLFSYSQNDLIQLLKIDIKLGILESKSIIIITHRIDSGLFNYVEESISSQLHFIVIFNHTKSEKHIQKKNRHFFNTLRDKGARIIEVHSAETIKEDMENYGATGYR
ncbi:MAG: DUF58 domain-containing protein [Spirochaetales bacterium]|nr:DUF58 domain-containing protein [Spirochaetales bacterium]